MSGAERYLMTEEVQAWIATSHVALRSLRAATSRELVSLLLGGDVCETARVEQRPCCMPFVKKGHCTEAVVFTGFIGTVTSFVDGSLAVRTDATGFSVYGSGVIVDDSLWKPEHKLLGLRIAKRLFFEAVRTQHSPECSWRGLCG